MCMELKIQHKHTFSVCILIFIRVRTCKGVLHELTKKKSKHTSNEVTMRRECTARIIKVCSYTIQYIELMTLYEGSSVHSHIHRVVYVQRQVHVH